MAKEYKDLVVGLDIGTAKVMVVVAEVMPGGELKLARYRLARFPFAAVKRPQQQCFDLLVQGTEGRCPRATQGGSCTTARSLSHDDTLLKPYTHCCTT